MCQDRMNQVIALLEGFPNMQRKIAVLRYELEHPATVSPDEMIEALSFARGDSEGHSSGNISNKTLYIAMNYQTEAARLSSETMDEITGRLMPLEREINRLEHYLGLLSERDQIILRKLVMSLYESITDGILTREEYARLKQNYAQRGADAERQMNALQEEILAMRDKGCRERPWIEQFRKHENLTELERGTVVSLIDRITIYADKRVELRYR